LQPYPLSEGDTSVILAERIFRLMDSNRDGFINFKELAQTFNALCKGDHVLKLRLFYCLHLPGVVLPDELVNANNKHLDEVDGADEACDAEQFFNDASKSLDEITEKIKDPSEEAIGGENNSSGDATSLRSLHRRLFSTATSTIPEQVVIIFLRLIFFLFQYRYFSISSKSLKIAHFWHKCQQKMCVNMPHQRT
jgi:hypothetical protein